MPPAPSPGGGRGGAAMPPSSKPQSPLRITHEGEFYARLLSRESSLGNPSFRYYGAGTGAVPFVWESQPGTPKDAYSSRILTGGAAVAPVITPPPSYYLHGVPPLGHSARRHGKTGGAGGRSGRYFGYKLKWVKVGFIATVFRRLALGKSRSSSSSVKSSSSTTSSTRWLFSGSASAAGARDQEEYCGYDPEPRATKGVLCLGIRASPWMVQFCSGQREQAGWVYGWRP